MVLERTQRTLNSVTRYHPDSPDITLLSPSIRQLTPTLCFGLVFATTSIAEAASGLQDMSFNFVQLVSNGAIAIIFASLCFFLYRLNQRLEKNLRNHEATKRTLIKLSSAVTNSGASIVITDADGCIEYVNQKFCTSSGYLEHELIGHPISILTPHDFHAEDSAYLFNTSCLVHNWEGDALCARKDQQLFWSAITVSAVCNESENVSNYVLSAIDISALKSANKKMQHLALFDSLTGLANRRLFIDRLQQSIINAQRYQQTTALLFLDLDQFKRINDTLGHQAGDELLLIIAGRLSHSVREQDTVARLGGDEFTILLNNINAIDNIVTIAEQVLHTLKQPIKLGQHEVIVSTSIGITVAPTDSRCGDTLMKNADLALYRAKENGRDCYHFFTEDLNVRAKHQLYLENELRQALQNEDFYLKYQPQIDLKSGEVHCVEALIRWRHPQNGDIQPMDFISVAEDTGLIVPIGEWVLRQACREIHAMQQQTGKDLRVAVNLSPRQFNDLSLVDTVASALQESGLSAEHLELEVTESMLMNDMNTVVEQLNRIKSTGTTITIDDFGSGYSSLSYLKSLPVDILKVDKEFVTDIPEDLSAMEIASAVVAVAHKLNLKVVAEGVENIDQHDFLVINQCDYAQGYLFSHPLTFDNLLQYFCKEGLRSA